MNTSKNYDLVMHKFKYGGLGEREMFVDENCQNLDLKSVHFGIADDLIKNNMKKEAFDMLEKVRKEFQYVQCTLLFTK